MKIKKLITGGFTIVEIMVVVFVIGILASITYISYNGVQKKVVDVGVDSDVQRMAALQTKYKSDHGATGVAYYSGNGAGSSLGFTPKTGNVIDVVINSTGYCVRGYNVKGNENSITNASIKESSSGICSQISASAFALAGYNNIKLSVQLTSGYTNNCIVATDNLAYCWGNNSNGQLGNNSTTQSLVPIAVDTSGVLNGKTMKSITGSNGFTCAIASDGLAYCWGLNAHGQLGNNSTTQSLVPVAVNTVGVLSGKTIKSIATGNSHTCAIASDDQVYCWGYGWNGQLGNNSTTQSLVPVAVNTAGVLSGKTVKSITSGDIDTTCAIASDDLAYCWGMNSEGELGNNSTVKSLVPVAVNTAGALNGKTIKSITMGTIHVCAVASNSQVYCWGYDGYGQLGNNSTTQSNVPVAVDTSGVLNGKTVLSIAANGSHTCAIASDNKAYCWGYNWYGQLGNNSTTQSLVPVAVNTAGALNGKTIISVSTGGNDHSCALTSDYSVYCWGYNGYGQLGNNSTTQSLVPVAVNVLP